MSGEFAAAAALPLAQGCCTTAVKSALGWIECMSNIQPKINFKVVVKAQRASLSLLTVLNNPTSYSHVKKQTTNIKLTS